MTFKKYYLVVLFFILQEYGFCQVRGMDESPKYYGSVSLTGAVTSNNQIPFWMRTNQYGSIPMDGISSCMMANLYRPFKDSNSHKIFDWSAGANARFDIGKDVKLTFLELYLKSKISIFQASIGRTKDMVGLVDSSLSSGAFAVSGNALGIPKIELSIPDYWSIPGTNKLISIKGSFSVGYFGNEIINQTQFEPQRSLVAYYHQKSLYGRIGKPNWRVAFYGGFNHQVMFGSEREYLGSEYSLSPAETFVYVVLGKAYGANNIPTSKIGNHIGSVDQAVSYNFNSIMLMGYHQFFYDVGALYHLTNLKDGLWGISFENKEAEEMHVNWRKFLIEFLNSKSQGGELTEKITPSGDEDYYNNYIYHEGWSYKGENIGNNFFTNKKYQRKELPQYTKEYFGNNRLMLLHLGIQWHYGEWDIINKLSFSRNYGTYATSPIGNTTGRGRLVQPPPYFYPVNQFSAYIQASRNLKNNYNIAFVFATDYGDLLYNSLGGMIKLTKSW